MKRNTKVTEEQKKQIKVLHAEPFSWNPAKIARFLSLGSQTVRYYTSPHLFGKGKETKIIKGLPKKEYMRVYNKEYRERMSPERKSEIVRRGNELKKKKRAHNKYMREYMKLRRLSQKSGSFMSLKDRKKQKAEEFLRMAKEAGII